MRAPIAASLFCAMVATAARPGHADEWQHVKDKQGVVYDRRSVAGSKFYEYRATFDVERAPADMVEAIWKDVTKPPGAQVTKRELLKQSDSELVIHDQIKTPVVADRELTLRMWREPDAVRFEARNDLGPPPLPGHVVLPRVRGSWVVTPSGGGARVVYMCYSEPGGSVPAFMVRGTQQDQVMKDVEQVLRRMK